MFILCFVFFLSKLVNVTDLLPYKYVDHCNKEKYESSLIIINISLSYYFQNTQTHSHLFSHLLFNHSLFLLL